MADYDDGEWAEWLAFTEAYQRGELGRQEVPSLPKIISHIRDKAAQEGAVAQICDLETAHPTNSDEVR